MAVPASTKIPTCLAETKLKMGSSKRTKPNNFQLYLAIRSSLPGFLFPVGTKARQENTKAPPKNTRNPMFRNITSPVVK